MSTINLHPELPEPQRYKVLGIDDSASQIVIRAEGLGLTAQCPYCQGVNIGAWGQRPQSFRDLPYAGKHVEIHINTKRLRCGTCGKTFSQSLPGMDDYRLMTRRLARWIGEQGLRRTFISIADDIGVVEGTIRNVFGDFVEAMERAVIIETPHWMALQEVHVLNKPRTLVLNPGAQTVVDIIEGRNKLSVSKYFSRINDPERVQLVGMGFVPVYLEAVRGYLPRALAFISKPQVLQLADDAMAKARASLRATHQRSEQHKVLALKPLLGARESALTASGRAILAEWFKSNQSLAHAYQAKEAIHALYDSPPAPAEAAARFDEAMARLDSQSGPWFAELEQALSEWRPQVLAYFRADVDRASFANLGDMSTLSGQVENMGRSYVFEALRCKLLFPEQIPAMPYRSPGPGLHLLQAHASDARAPNS